MVTSEGTFSAQSTFKTGYPPSTMRYDWLLALLGMLSTCGGYVDLWAHTHIPQLETFFTPWHGVLYGSFLLNAVVLAATSVMNHRKGYAWSHSLPRGYGLAMVGVFIYALGGVGDMFWHILFGIEKNVEALLSPTHLVLALGGFLRVWAPLRSAWSRVGEENLHGWRGSGPLLLSLVSGLAGFMFFSTYADPFMTTWASARVSIDSQTGYIMQALGVSSVLIQTALLMGPVLLVVRRWHLPFGALTLVFTLLQVFVSVPGDTYFLLPVALLAGLCADVLLLWLKPSATRAYEFHIFAFLAPLALYLLYFLELAWLPGKGVAWSVHMWMGSAVLAGVVSLLLSFLLLPPRGIVAHDTVQ